MTGYPPGDINYVRSPHKIKSGNPLARDLEFFIIAHLPNFSQENYGVFCTSSPTSIITRGID
jgi:hypothetical protein